VLTFFTFEFPEILAVLKGYIGNGDYESDKKQCGIHGLIRYCELQDEVNPEANCKNENALRNIAKNSHLRHINSSILQPH